MAEVKPMRIQIRRAKGFNLQEVSRALNGLPAISCARPGEFGNPFRIGSYFMIGDPEGKRGPFGMAWCEAISDEAKFSGKFTEITNAAMAVDFYKRLLAIYPLSTEKIARLRGRNLACYCELDEPCHVNTLLPLANA